MARRRSARTRHPRTRSAFTPPPSTAQGRRKALSAAAPPRSISAERRDPPAPTLAASAAERRHRLTRRMGPLRASRRPEKGVESPILPESGQGYRYRLSQYLPKIALVYMADSRYHRTAAAARPRAACRLPGPGCGRDRRHGAADPRERRDGFLSRSAGPAGLWSGAGRGRISHRLAHVRSANRCFFCFFRLLSPGCGGKSPVKAADLARWASGKSGAGEGAHYVCFIYYNANTTPPTPPVFSWSASLFRAYGF